MVDLLLFALAGFAASLVDGALGMGFGPTSSSILLSTGLAPTAVSASVNLAKVATGIVAAISHWRFRNIDRDLVLKLALPGCLGALVGVTVLSNVNGATIRPYLAMLLTVIGLRILVRFARPLPPKMKDSAPVDGSSKRELQYDRRGVKMAGISRWCDQRHDRGVGPGGHAVPAPPRRAPALRDWLGQHGRDRGGRRLGLLVDSRRSARAASISPCWCRCWSAVSSRRRWRPG